MVLGVAGLYCAGKNQVVEELRSRGFREIDVDKLGHKALDHCTDELSRIFSSRILDNKGKINRAALGRIVFGNSKNLARLEKTVHPVMRAWVAQEIQDNADADIVINAALLFPMNLDQYCDSVLWVHASWVKRYIRALKRDGLGLWATYRRLRSQAHLLPQFSSCSVDIHTVDNSKDRRTVADEVSGILDRLRNPVRWSEEGNGAQ
jgi:dephospho-CoA kinase